MYSQPQWDSPRGPQSSPWKTVALVVIGVLLGSLLLCFGGVLLVGWNSGAGDAISCYQLTANGEYKEAIPHCRAAVRRLPNSGETHNELGWCLALDGQTKEAVKECNLAVQLAPTRESYDSLAMALARDGRGQEALEIENDHVVVGGDVQDEAERVTLGMVYFSVDRKEEAFAQWELARKSDDSGVARLAKEFEAKYPAAPFSGKTQPGP